MQNPFWTGVERVEYSFGGKKIMSEKLVDEKHSVEALKEMLTKKPSKEPVEKVLTTFCQRYGLSMETCRSYYDELIKKGDVKK